MKKKILIISELDENSLKELEKFFLIRKVVKSDFLSEDQLIKEMNIYKPEILIVSAEKITKQVIKSSPTLQMIVVTRGNPVNVDIDICKEEGIIVTCTPGRNSNSVAELVIALMISLSRHLFQAYEAVKNGTVTIDKKENALDKGNDVIWTDPSLKEVPYSKFKGFDIEGKTVGLIGFGAIGKKTADKAIGLGMNVLVFDPYVSKEDIQNAGAISVLLDKLLSDSDFVSLHCKVTKETEKIIGEKELFKMKKTAYLINTARGALIDHEALFKALKEKQIAGAAVDTFYYEPIAHDDPFLELDNFVITPHIGGASVDVVKYQSKMALESILAYAHGEEIPYRIV